MEDAPSIAAPQFSVVLPVQNQADHLERMVESHIAAMDRLGWPYELLLVTNGCSDDSPAIARALAQRHPPVCALDLPTGGWGRAVKAGLRESRGDILCYTNSARTTPEMLTVHLAYAKAYPEVVLKANRKIRDNALRRLGSLLYNLEARALYDLPWWDVNGTPKVFPRRFSRLMELERDDDLIDLEFSAICREAAYPIVEIPILATHRVGGRSTTRLRSAAAMYLRAIAMRRSARAAR